MQVWETRNNRGKVFHMEIQYIGLYDFASKIVYNVNIICYWYQF